MNELRVSQETRGDLAVVHVDEARLNADNASLLERVFSQQVEKGARRFVVDLSETEFMDCRSLGVLVTVLKRTGRSRSVALVGAQGSVARLLTLTGLDRAFALYPSPAAAPAKPLT